MKFTIVSRGLAKPGGFSQIAMSASEARVRRNAGRELFGSSMILDEAGAEVKDIDRRIKQERGGR